MVELMENMSRDTKGFVKVYVVGGNGNVGRTFLFTIKETYLRIWLRVSSIH